jgi:cobalt-precorrin 5A hydrolase
MTRTVVIALPRFIGNAQQIASFLSAEVREYTPDIFEQIFPDTERIVALMSMGIVVRKIAPLLRNKWNDPAVVVVSPNFRFAIPVLGGHHGANELAKELSGIGLCPVITTATESTGKDSAETIAERTGNAVLTRDSTRTVNAAMLDIDVPVFAVKGPAVVIAGADVSILIRKGEYSVGIGCRRGIRPEEVVEAIEAALAVASIGKDEVMVYATTTKKFDENGLKDAISSLSGNLIFLDDETINAQTGISPSKATRIGLLGVAEPCALAVAKRKELVLQKKVYGRVTVAIAH